MVHKRPASILCMFLVALCGVCLSENSSAETLVSQGDEFLKSGQYDKALNSFGDAISLDPDNYNTYYKRAGIYLLKGKYLPALSDLNKILEMNPTFNQARLRRGKTLLTLGRPDDAKLDYELVLKSKPNDIMATNGLESVKKYLGLVSSANNLIQQNRAPEAVPFLNEALDLASESKSLRLLRAEASLNAQDYNRVLEDTMTVLKQQSGNLQALYLRGRAFYFLGEREAAIKHYSQALKYDPEDTLSKAEFKRLSKLDKASNQAATLFGQGQFSEALAEYETAIELEPNNIQVSPNLYVGKCKCHLKLRQNNEAIAACSKAIEMDGNQVDAFIARAEVYMQLDDFDKAIFDYQKAREKQPQNHAINQGLAEAQKRQKMAKRKDHYKILGLTKDASPQEIRKSYRKLALEWHPDRQEDPEKKDMAKERYVEIATAYEILSDEESRGRYDRGEDLEQPMQQGFQQGFPFGGGGGPFHFTFNFGGGG
eukprot:TRINITY_DN977_c0_g1_i1.p1 TRINITY_DN977_c0_g1~~TRINITY_DN977_c0_g1_i1.p1  ORF type:complete len:484 (-),score=116.50 TRINITY_DN977_c0_g1_i1:123-1574(-)